MDAQNGQPGGTPAARRGGPRYTDAAPVARLLRKWHREGIAYDAMARTAGVSDSVVRDIVGAKRARVRYSTVRRLTALDTDAARRASANLTTGALATVRMMRAMSALGHLHEEMAARIGVRPQHFSELINGKRPYVRQCTADAVAALYDAWSMSVGPSVANRNRAARRGWAPPLAWEYLDMADPGAVPYGVDHAKHAA